MVRKTIEWLPRGLLRNGIAIARNTRGRDLNMAGQREVH